MPRHRLIIEGRVHGVGFRASIADQARRLGLTGWVRNRFDGSVETVAEGTAEALANLARFCRKGPVGAKVDGVDTRDETETGEFSAFSIRSST